MRLELMSPLDILLMNFFMRMTGNGYYTKGLKRSKKDKTEHGNGKSVKNRSRRPHWQSSTLLLAKDAWHMIQGLQMIAWGLDKIRRLTRSEGSRSFL
ncbi:hypothetical protein Tco_0774680 [Tanacetum coccineum]|uniref:Uncharacterized protein n=1 Tax=Tanacetum coccineum TaxID=301880 RepID=A0ABQ4ZP64_9ASTR